MYLDDSCVFCLVNHFLDCEFAANKDLKFICIVAYDIVGFWAFVCLLTFKYTFRHLHSILLKYVNLDISNYIHLNIPKRGQFPIAYSIYTYLYLLMFVFQW